MKKKWRSYLALAMALALLLAALNIPALADDNTTLNTPGPSAEGTVGNDTAQSNPPPAA